MNYSRMYMYEQRGSMHIHKIILLTPRDRRQIVEVTLKVLRDEGTGSDRGGAGRGGGGGGTRRKSRCGVASKDARFLHRCGRARISAFAAKVLHDGIKSAQ